MELDIRRMTRTDLDLLARWLGEPHVTRTEWNEHDPDDVEEDFGPSIEGDDPTALWIVLEGSRPVGLIQDYRIGDYPEWLSDLNMIADAAEAIGIDYLIGEPDAVGRGLGESMIRDHLRSLWDRYPDAPSVVVGVAADNRPSWRSLEKAGFQRVWAGVLPSDSPDGPTTLLYRLPRPS
ncbi:MAG TPA: GNAT family N-acetyltransferase [Acidimicrobiia bacterium]|nr:GNAT family N-acetyltransferase [Acidimicrobiia bacterium]